MHDLHLATTWVGWLSLIIFVVSYYFIAREDKYDINKAKPALFAGTAIFMLIGLYFSINGLDGHSLELAVEHLIVEIAEIFFFLLVAMTYIEAMISKRVFFTLRYRLVAKGYNYKQLFWITGVIAFFLSPIADNLTTALILSTVLLTIDKKKINFLVVGAINIVVAANAGGAWSPFGDITTLMVWVAGKGSIADFLLLFPAAIIGWLITAFLLSKFVPEGKPELRKDEPEIIIARGGKMIIALFIVTITMAVLSHSALHLPAMFGMMFGLALLKVYTYYLNNTIKKNSNEKISNPFAWIAKIEVDTLLFFFGILAAVGGLHFLGFLEYFTALYTYFGPTITNIGVGFLSAIIDNVPVMSAVLKSNPDMGPDVLSQWLLVTLTAGIGGSMISFGSAAGVGVMGKMKGIYTFSAHMKYAWTILIGYVVSIFIWYFQFNVL